MCNVVILKSSKDITGDNKLILFIFGLVWWLPDLFNLWRRDQLLSLGMGRVLDCYYYYLMICTCYYIDMYYNTATGPELSTVGLNMQAFGLDG